MNINIHPSKYKDIHNALNTEFNVDLIIKRYTILIKSKQ